jgi:hypothetical protein
MKDVKLLIWLTQLGLSVVFPLAGFILLALWLQQQFSWDGWVFWVGLVLGLITAVSGFVNSLQLMLRMSENSKKKDPPPTAFNQHD